MRSRAMVGASVGVETCDFVCVHGVEEVVAVAVDMGGDVLIGEAED